MIPLPTEEDLQAIKRHLIIPMVITVLQRDKKVLEQWALKTKQPYLSLMDSAMKKAHGEIYDTRVFLRSKGIKIYQVGYNRGHFAKLGNIRVYKQYTHHLTLCI